MPKILKLGLKTLLDRKRNKKMPIFFFLKNHLKWAQNGLETTHEIHHFNQIFFFLTHINLGLYGPKDLEWNDAVSLQLVLSGTTSFHSGWRRDFVPDLQPGYLDLVSTRDRPRQNPIETQQISFQFYRFQSLKQSMSHCKSIYAF